MEYVARRPFLDLVKERVVVLDGAMGANLQCRTLHPQHDWLGHENCSEILNLSRPDVIGERRPLGAGGWQVAYTEGEGL